MRLQLSLQENNIFKVGSHALRRRNTWCVSTRRELDAGTPREGSVGAFTHDCEHMTGEFEEIDFETSSHDCLIEHLDPSGYCATHNCVAYPVVIIVLAPNLGVHPAFRLSWVSGQCSSTRCVYLTCMYKKRG